MVNALKNAVGCAPLLKALVRILHNFHRFDSKLTSIVVRLQVAVPHSWHPRTPTHRCRFGLLPSMRHSFACFLCAWSMVSRVVYRMRLMCRTTAPFTHASQFGRFRQLRFYHTRPPAHIACHRTESAPFLMGFVSICIALTMSYCTACSAYSMKCRITGPASRRAVADRLYADFAPTRAAVRSRMICATFSQAVVNDNGTAVVLASVLAHLKTDTLLLPALNLLVAISRQPAHVPTLVREGGVPAVLAAILAHLRRCSCCYLAERDCSESPAAAGAPPLPPPPPPPPAPLPHTRTRARARAHPIRTHPTLNNPPTPHTAHTLH